MYLDWTPLNIFRARLPDHRPWLFANDNPSREALNRMIGMRVRLIGTRVRLISWDSPIRAKYVGQEGTVLAVVANTTGVLAIQVAFADRAVFYLLEEQLVFLL